MSEWQGRPGANDAFKLNSIVNGVEVPRVRPISMAPSVGKPANTGSELKPRKESPVDTASFCSRTGGPGMMSPPKAEPKVKGKPDTERQKKMLGFIRRHKGICTQHLADRMGMDMKCTGRMLKRLVEKNLIEDRGVKKTEKAWHPL